jgi:hypothetical protein
MTKLRNALRHGPGLGDERRVRGSRDDLKLGVRQCTLQIFGRAARHHRIMLAVHYKDRLPDARQIRPQISVAQ